MGKPKGPAPVAPCKLCSRVGPLIWSHVVPRWIYRRIAQTGEDGGRIPVRVEDGVARLESDQAATYLLCSQCEDLFRHWESYVSKVSHDDGDEFPALAMARDHLISGASVAENFVVADVSGLDVDAIVLFGVSVLWRAAAWPERFPDVTLGPYFDVFARFLRGEVPFPRRARLLLTLFDRPAFPNLSKLITPPGRGSFRGHPLYAFIFFGMSFEFLVGGNDRHVYDYACLAHTKRAVITNGERHLRHLASQVEGVRAVGTLASRPEFQRTS